MRLISPIEIVLLLVHLFIYGDLTKTCAIDFWRPLSGKVWPLQTYHAAPATV